MSWGVDVATAISTDNTCGLIFAVRSKLRINGMAVYMEGLGNSAEEVTASLCVELIVNEVEDKQESCRYRRREPAVEGSSLTERLNE